MSFIKNMNFFLEITSTSHK